MPFFPKNKKRFAGGTADAVKRKKPLQNRRNRKSHAGIISNEAHLYSLPAINSLRKKSSTLPGFLTLAWSYFL